MGWIKAIDRYQLAPTEDGRTTVTMGETMSGPLLTLFYNDGKLRKGHLDALRMLKAAAEELAPGPLASPVRPWLYVPFVNFDFGLPQPGFRPLPRPGAL
jgi:hypothetical protein